MGGCCSCRKKQKKVLYDEVLNSHAFMEERRKNNFENDRPKNKRTTFYTERRTNLKANLADSIGDSIIMDIMDSAWPVVKRFFERKVLRNIEKTISKALSEIKLLKSFSFTNITLGEVYPRIGNFKIVSKSVRDIIIQVDVGYKGDADISMVVGTSLVDIPLGIKNISFSGILRIEFRDLVPEAPIVSAVVAYFVKRPLLEFNLTKAANIADMPVLFKSVRSKIVDVVATASVCPNRIVIPLAAPDASIYKFPLPRYLVFVSVIRAENLINTDDGWFHLFSGKSDPYCVFHMNSWSRSRTKTINNNLNPQWNHETIFAAHKSDEIIKFELFDEDINADDDLGYCQLNLAHIENDWCGWINLRNAIHGKLKVRIEKLFPVKSDISDYSLSSDALKVTYIQFYMGEILIQGSARKVQSQKNDYKVTVVFSHGEKIIFDKPKITQQKVGVCAKWEKAEHKYYSGNIRGRIEVSHSTPGGETRYTEGLAEDGVLVSIPFDLSTTSLVEWNHKPDRERPISLKARITRRDYESTAKFASATSLVSRNSL